LRSEEYNIKKERLWENIVVLRCAKFLIRINVMNKDNKYSNNTTTDEILEAVNVFANKTEERFSKLEDDVGEIKVQIGSIETRVGSIETRVGSIETRVGSIETRVGSIETRMVTKDYLDDKLADLRGDLVVLMRKEDVKFEALLKTLLKREVLSIDEINNILALEPFPRKISV